MEKTVVKGVKGKKNAGSFAKGHSRPGPGRGHKKSEVRLAAEGIVKDMERAYTQDEQAGEGTGVREARLLAKNDYPKFLALYLKAKELAGGKEPGDDAEGSAAAADYGTGEVGVKEESIEAMAIRLLDEWELEDGRNNGGNGDDARQREPQEDRQG